MADDAVVSKKITSSIHTDSSLISQADYKESQKVRFEEDEEKPKGSSLNEAREARSEESNDGSPSTNGRDDDSDDEESIYENAFTEIPAPGPESFVDWFANSPYPTEDEPPIFGSGDEETPETPRQESGKAVRDFMGPYDDSLAMKFRKRRERTIRMRRSTLSQSNQDPSRYKYASYKKTDSAVFQHYSMQLAELHRQEEREHERRKVQQRQSIGVAVPTPPQRKRLFAGLTRCLIACPHARSKTKNNPIGAYQQEVQYWTRFMLILLGFVISIVILIIKRSSDSILDAKNDLVTNPTLFGETHLTNTTISGMGRVTGAGNYGWKCFGIFLAFNLCFVVLSFLPVAYRPVSGGSGIAEAKATLNGVILPTCTDLLTAICKAISVIFAGAASLPIGLEGPLIFIGLAIGHNVQRFVPKTYPALKSEEMKRDFAAIGCACGVAGAFLTPVGGVLFAMEEGASFWCPLLAWRSFAAACVTTICLYLWGWLIDTIEDAGEGEPLDSFFDIHSMSVYSGLEGQRGLSQISADQFFRSVPAFRVYDFVFFAIIGMFGGILGALWIEANQYLTRLRMKLDWGRKGKFFEIIGLTTLTSFCFWFLPLIYTKCNPVSDTDLEDLSILRQLNCPDGHYNQLGTLLLNSPGTIGLNLLYWERAHHFDPIVLLIAGFTYHLLLLLLFGTSISMGIFIPLLFIGACYGRALTILALRTSLINVNNRNPMVSTYTMVCSVALLAGVARVLISITVIMVFSIGTTYLVTPFMIATLFAKVAGKAMLGRPGIYDVILEMKGIPFLESECPNSMIMRGLCAQDVMSRPPLVSLEPQQSIGRLLDSLEQHPGYDDFPVVDPGQNGVFLGVITRSCLLTLLTQRKLFCEKSDLNENGKAVKFEYLVNHLVQGNNGRSIRQRITADDRNKFIDLTPYVSIGHYTINRFASVRRAFQVFRSLGLRTLVVTDAFGRPMGFITRHDLKLLEEVGVEEAYYTSRHERGLEKDFGSSYDLR